MTRLLSFTVALALAAGSAHAGVISHETFDTDGTLDDYTGEGNLFSSYVLADDPVVGVSDGELNMALTPNVDGSLHTHIDFGGVQSLLSMQIDFNLNSGNAASSAFGLHLGTFANANSFDPSWHTVGPSLRTWASVTADHTSNLTLRNADRDPEATYQQTVGEFSTWNLYFNQSGSDQAFFGPDGAMHTLNTDAWTMFVDSTLVAANIGKGMSGQSEDLQGAIFHINRNHGGAGVDVSLGAVQVRNDLDLYIPEPASLGLVGAGGLLMLLRRRTKAA